VLVAASSAVSRAGLEAILSREPGLVLVGGSGAASLVDAVAECEPDVVVLELGANDSEDALAALQVLAVDADDAGHAAPAVVLLSEERDPARLGEALRAGVRALLPRDARSAEIVAAVAAAAAGLVSVAPEWVDVLSTPAGAAMPNGARGAATPLAAPSAREREVLRLIADGLANKQIAARLGISEHTVKFHVASLFAKLRASTRAEAVMRGARLGWIVL
jgi:NarL family two-component system response regulator YdfI